MFLILVLTEKANDLNNEAPPVADTTDHDDTEPHSTSSGANGVGQGAGAGGGRGSKQEDGAVPDSDGLDGTNDDEVVAYYNLSQFVVTSRLITFQLI